ncbi:MAG: branched-chain amino acid ABC transporter permease [Thermoleophilia bacterium]|nr:branched-chain amino acid ABC transporter permease [Thermoleophilia bacterium]
MRDLEFKQQEAALARNRLLAQTRNWPLMAVLVAITLLLVAAPFALGGYWMRVLTVVFIFATMAEAVNIIAGYTGYPALGNAVFFGTGAYVAAIAANELGVSLAPAIVLAGLGCVTYAVVLGLPILRLSGRYFLMATLGLMEITREVVLNLDITGGAQGQIFPSVTSDPVLANRLFYYLGFGLLLLTALATWWIQNHNIGLALRAIKFDEEAARAMGINTTVYKTAAWAVSAFFTGMGGPSTGISWPTSSQQRSTRSRPRCGCTSSTCSEERARCSVHCSAPASWSFSPSSCGPASQSSTILFLVLSSC